MIIFTLLYKINDIYHPVTHASFHNAPYKKKRRYIYNINRRDVFISRRIKCLPRFYNERAFWNAMLQENPGKILVCTYIPIN